MKGNPLLGIWCCKRCGKEYFPNQLENSKCPICGGELIYDEEA